jgi:hypothetical protein
VHSRAGQAVLAWAVLAGLFLMHGAASPAGGCGDGAPVMAVAAASLTPATPDASMVHAAPEAAHQAVSHAVGSRQAGMTPCSARQPRQGFLSVPVIRLAVGVLFLLIAVPVLRCLAVPRRVRPPGRPGLPLPLLLGISRT